MNKQAAIKLGLAALEVKNPELVAKYKPFVAEFSKGVWFVGGTNPKDVRGGGAPTIEIRDRDEKVLRIYFSR